MPAAVQDKYPEELDASVLLRLPCRTSTDDRYFGDQWQVWSTRSQSQQSLRAHAVPQSRADSAASLAVVYRPVSRLALARIPLSARPQRCLLSVGCCLVPVSPMSVATLHAVRRTTARLPNVARWHQYTVLCGCTFLGAAGARLHAHLREHAVRRCKCEYSSTEDRSACLTEFAYTTYVWIPLLPLLCSASSLQWSTGFTCRQHSLGHRRY